MFLDPAAPVIELMAQYGLAVIFVLLVLDSAGVPFPTEIVMIMAVALYVTDIPSLLLVIFLTTVAALVGSFILYGVCFLGGRRLVEKKPKLFMMNPRRLERLERIFSRPAGKSLVFFLRLFPLTRVLVTIPAGIARMGALPFIALTFLGMTIYHTVLAVLAYRYGGAGGGGLSMAAVLDTPAWHYVAAHQVLTVVALLALGLLLAFRSARATIKDPEWNSTSKLGWFSERVAVFGGFLTIFLVTVAPATLYAILRLGGVDLPVLAERLHWDAASFLTAISLLAIVLGLPLMALSTYARRKSDDFTAVKYGLRETAEVTMKPAPGAAAATAGGGAPGPRRAPPQRAPPRGAPPRGAPPRGGAPRPGPRPGPRPPSGAAPPGQRGGTRPRPSGPPERRDPRSPQ